MVNIQPTLCKTTKPIECNQNSASRYAALRGNEGLTLRVRVSQEDCFRQPETGRGASRLHSHAERGNEELFYFGYTQTNSDNR
ncbi:MAG: hypothetical protein GY749_01830 [Desulfobacteraceae bacterium]|nr:hypothetical protein [Desulfobacteraceae bacterium]